MVYSVYCQKNSGALYCTVLYCIVLYCTVLYCTYLRKAQRPPEAAIKWWKSYAWTSGAGGPSNTMYCTLSTLLSAYLQVVSSWLIFCLWCLLFKFGPWCLTYKSLSVSLGHWASHWVHSDTKVIIMCPLSWKRCGPISLSKVILTRLRSVVT